MTKAVPTVDSPKPYRKPPPCSHAELLALLDYDPEAGIFTWRSRPVESFKRRSWGVVWNTRYAGKVAGAIAKRAGTDYIVIAIHKKPTLAHRLAVYYMTAEWPPDGVDHCDCNGLNNRWENLRPATQLQNAGNTRLMSTNTSGLKGAFLHEAKHRRKRYQAKIRFNKKNISLGYYETAEEAHAAYMAAAIKYRGEFARAS